MNEDYKFNNSIISMLCFQEVIINYIVVMWENVLCLRRYKLNFLGVKGHDVCKANKEIEEKEIKQM